MWPFVKYKICAFRPMYNGLIKTDGPGQRPEGSSGKWQRDRQFTALKKTFLGEAVGDDSAMCATHLSWYMLASRANRTSAVHIITVRRL